MILGVIQRSEVGPVVFDFRPIGDIKTDGSKNGFDSLPGLDDWMNTTDAPAASGQSDIDGFGREPAVQLGLGDTGTSLVEQFLDLLLDLVDTRPLLPLLLGLEAGKPFQ